MFHKDILTISYENNYEIRKVFKEILGLEGIAHFSIDIARSDSEMIFLSSTPAHGYEICKRGLALFSYPIFLLLTKNNIYGLILADLILIIFLGLCAGSLMPILMKFFPKNLKFIGIAIGFNLSMTIFGSMTPLAAISLVKITSSANAPFFCLIAASVITLAGIKYSGFYTVILEEMENTVSNKVAYDN